MLFNNHFKIKQNKHEKNTCICVCMADPLVSPEAITTLLMELCSNTKKKLKREKIKKLIMLLFYYNLLFKNMYWLLS